MPRWLHNTLFVIVIIISMGCVASGMQWKPKEDKETAQ